MARGMHSVGGVHGRGCVWWGECMVGGMNGWGHVWQGACVAGGVCMAYGQ